MGREREKAASGQGLITLAKAICASAIIMFLFSHITITNASGTFFEETVTIQRLGTASESGLGLVEYGYGGGLESVAFDLSFGSGLGGNQNAQAAFNRAANCWAEVLDDPVTVRLNLDYTSLGSGILGSASTTMLIGGYDLVRGLVVSNAGEINNAREEALLENLPVASEVSTYMPKGFGLDGRLMLWAGMGSTVLMVVLHFQAIFHGILIPVTVLRRVLMILKRWRRMKLVTFSGLSAEWIMLIGNYPKTRQMLSQ